MKTKPVFPPTYLLIALISMLILNFIYPYTRIIPLPWNLLGLLSLVAGIVLNLLADRVLHVAGTTVKPFQQSTTLVSGGVYQISRHPMYLGFAFILIGVAILFGSLTPWVIIPLFVVLMEVVFIRNEECMLAEKFGPEWEAYKKKVRRWI
jgi:protein-S-isoprenylcysteine O-methyltransferase Ste14